MTTLATIPQTIVSGDSVDVLLTIADYPASAGWSVRWALAGPSTLEVESTPDAVNGHRLQITPTQSAQLNVGAYQWRVRAINGDTAETFASGGLDVQADLATVSPGETTSWQERTLAMVEAALSGTIEPGMKSYMIQGRQIQHWGIDELLGLRAQLQHELAVMRGEFGTPLRFDVGWPKSYSTGVFYR